MPRTPNTLENGNIEWQETIEQPEGRNVFARNVELAAVDGAPPSDKNPEWLIFENLSSTVDSNDTRIRPVRIEVDPSELTSDRTYTFDIIASNGRETETRSVDLDIVGVPRVDYELEYKRAIAPNDDVKNTVTLFLPQRKQTDFSEASFSFDIKADVDFNVKSFTAVNLGTGQSISTETSVVTNVDITGSTPAGQVSSETDTITTIDSGFPATSNQAFPREIRIPNLTPADWDGTKVTLNWITTDPDVDTYNVYRTTDPSSGFTQIASGVSTQSYDDTGVSEDTTYFYEVSSVMQDSTETPRSFRVGITTEAEIFIEGFEDDDQLLKWDRVSSGFDTRDFAYGGRRSGGTTDSSADNIQAVKEFSPLRRPDRFSFKYHETSDSTGGGFRLLNANLDVELAVATDNPEWEFEDPDGTTTEVFDGTDDSGDEVYEVWHEVNIEFDWANGEFDYEWIRLSDGETVTGTRSLGFGEQRVKLLRFENYNTGFKPGNTGLFMRVDDIELVKDVNAASVESVQINSGLVDVTSNVSSFPVYVDLSDLTDEWWSNSTGASSIQVFDDGGNEVPREVVSYDSANQTGQLWLKANTLKASSDTIFDIEGNGSFSGSEANTWSDYVGVWHLEEDPSGSAPQYIDATGNGNDGTAINSPTRVEGLIGQAANFDSGDDDRINVPDSAGLNPATSNFTLQAVVNLDNIPSNVRGIAGKRNPNTSSGPHYGLKTDGAQSFRFEIEDSGGENLVLKFSVDDSLSGTPPWYRLAVIRSATDTFELYSDGLLQDSQSGGNDVGDPGNSEDFNIGRFGPNSSIDGIVDEVRFRIGSRSDDWLRTENWNTDKPDSFYTIIS